MGMLLAHTSWILSDSRCCLTPLLCLILVLQDMKHPSASAWGWNVLQQWNLTWRWRTGWGTLKCSLFMLDFNKKIGREDRGPSPLFSVSSQDPARCRFLQIRQHCGRTPLRKGFLTFPQVILQLPQVSELTIPDLCLLDKSQPFKPDLVLEDLVNTPG